MRESNSDGGAVGLYMRMIVLVTLRSVRVRYTGKRYTTSVYVLYCSSQCRDFLKYDSF